MLRVRKSNERGWADHGWLKSLHSFSFAEYYDPAHMGFRSLRVINEDRIQGGTGFGRHPHRDMEIISYVIKGALEHKDSMGNATIISPGEVQRMTAGTGVMHSEYNKMSDQETHFFQIWIVPRHKGTTPGYGQKSFARELEEKNVVLVVSNDGRDGSISIDQDAELSIARLKRNARERLPLRPGRHAWIQVIRGSGSVNEVAYSAGDGIAISDETALDIQASEDVELLVFDLA